MLLLAAACVLAGACAGPREVPRAAEADPGALSGAAPAHSARVRAGGVEIALVVDDGPLALRRAELEAWVERSARAVEAYFGASAARRVTVEVRPVDGDGVQGGRTWTSREPLVRVAVGARASARDLAADWVLVHELVHAVMPALPPDQIWLEEGIASYVEPLARLRVGALTAEAVVREWVRSMPQGQPESGDRGLDRTHTWGRTYWGGALFCLVADVTIRERTQNRLGLEDALRAVAARARRRAVSLDDVIAAGDAAVGVPVLRELYQHMALRAEPVDLEDLWDRLGIRVLGRAFVLDDSAELAGARRAILGGAAGSGRALEGSTGRRAASDRLGSDAAAQVRAP